MVTRTAPKSTGRGTRIEASPSIATAINLASDTEGEWMYIRVGADGDLKVDYKNGGVGIVLKNARGGVYEPGVFTKIYSTANGTTATDLVAYEY